MRGAAQQSQGLGGVRLGYENWPEGAERIGNSGLVQEEEWVVNGFQSKIFGQDYVDGFIQTGIKGLLDEARLFRPDYLALILGYYIYKRTAIMAFVSGGVGV